MAPWGENWIVRFIRDRRGGSFDAGNEYAEDHKVGDLINTLLHSKVFLCEPRHGYGGCGVEDSGSSSPPSSSSSSSAWKPQIKMRTRNAALVLCLNIGVDPPDAINISPCARMECWIDPLSMGPGRALKEIGAALSSQYQQLQPNACFNVQLDPTMDDIRRLCNTCRLNARDERVLFHYNGHGVPKPTVSGEIWVYNRTLTQYIPLRVHELSCWLKTPSIYVFDCSAAASVLNAFVQLYDGDPLCSEKDFIVLAACETHESLPQSDDFPSDMFTSCLTTPIKMALRWLCSCSLFRDTLDIGLTDQVPGCKNDRRTLLGQLNWIFTAVTDVIAWSVLPHDLFNKLFRQDFLVANLFRNYLLAERILRSANCSPVTYPLLPPTHNHYMWDAWDMVAEICFLSFVRDPEAKCQPSPFFDEQLTAFEISLNHGSRCKKVPERLPIVLWALPSVPHRSRALNLLCRFLDLGPWAVNMVLSLGMPPYILKLLRITSAEIMQTLIHIWTKILTFDKSCQVEIVKDGAHLYFIKYLDNPEANPEVQTMATFVLTIIVNENRQGQEACLSSDLMHVCLRHLQTNHMQKEPLFLQWLCLCLGKLWEDHSEAQLLGLQTDASKVLAPLLLMSQAEVRASAAFAIGNLLDGGTSMVDNSSKMDMIQNLLTLVMDGSPLVRFEVAVALARFAFEHKECMKSVALVAEQSNYVIGLTESADSYGGRVDCTQFSTDYGRIMNQRKMVVSSSPAKKGVLYNSESGNSSQSSDSEILQDQNANVLFSCSGNKVLDCQICYDCVSYFYCLARDPSPRISDVGQKILRMIGTNVLSTNIPFRDGRKNLSNHLQKSHLTPEHGRLAFFSACFDLKEGYLSSPVQTSSGTPQGHIKGMRRVFSGSHLENLQKLGLADPIISSDQSGDTSEYNLLPHSSIYGWSVHHFSKPFLNPLNDEEEEEEEEKERAELSTKKEEREKYAMDYITKWGHASISKPNKQIICWDTKFESGVNTNLLEPFSPIIIAADENEQIRIWNYREDTLLNCFDNNQFSVKGVSKLSLLNELDDSLLLVASCDGNVRIWKDYIVRGEEKLVTAFSSLSSYGPRIQISDAVVDWQQLSGYLYATGKMSYIVPWDMEKEQCLSSIPSSSESGITALCAQVYGGQLVAGFEDGSVRLYDIRTPETNICTITSDIKRDDRVIGVGFQPGFDSFKVVSASQAGNLQYIDVRNPNEPFVSLDIKSDSLTSFAIHRHAPLVAISCANQSTKVFDINGNHLVTFAQKSQRNVGSVNYLSFHPYEAMLAAGTAKAVVSIYAE